MVKIIFFTKTKKLKNNKDQKQNFSNFLVENNINYILEPHLIA
jgi:hypothetical protein